MKKTLLILTIIWCSQQLNAQSIEKEIQTFTGQFAGEWTAYKMNSSGEIIKSMSWKDTLTTSDPIINDTLAFVNIKSIMTFDNPNIPPYKLDFKEGFKIKNGIILFHFFTVMGTEAIETKVDNGTYVISQPVSTFELNQMGFKNVVEAKNTTVKVILMVNGTEVHKISRITTIMWKENEQIWTKQFLSLEGFHKRIKK